MDGMITDIQRFSLKDGPGIRTTVFLKGCNMRCTWCHNPETIPAKNVLLFYPKHCVGCGACFAVCPRGAHVIRNEQHEIDRSICTGCAKCASECFTGALRMAAKRKSVEDVMREVRQDRLYYQESGGGVTISGGEVLCQPDFTAALIEACRAEGIPAAVESNVSFDFERIRATFHGAALIMCDLKLADDDAHRAYTGVSNRKIIENLLQLHTLNIPVILRTPIIPSSTDSDKNVAKIAQIAAQMKTLQYYELLNFNPLGTPKYDALGDPYAFRSAKPLSAERMNELAHIASQAGIPVRIG